MSSKNPTSWVLRRLTLLASICMLATACGGSDIPKPPIYVPVALHEVNSLVSLDVEIVKQDVYGFQLTYPFRAGDETDWARAWKLAGGSFKDADGHWVERGSPVTVRLAIEHISSNSRQRIFEQIVSNPKLSSSGADRLYANLAEMRLDPGRFRVTLVVLASDPSLSDAKADFRVGKAYVGK